MTKRTRYFMAGSAAVLAAGLCTGLVAYYGGGFQPLSASTGPDELRYIPADATVVAYADIRTIMDSEFRTRLKAAMPMHEHGQQEFKRHTGIDIERDVDYIVAAMTGVPEAGRHPSGLVVVRGRFNDAELETLAREHGGAEEKYRGKRLVSMMKGDGGGSVAFLETGLVAVGESAAIKKAIDAQMSATSITANTEMMDLVRDIGRTNNAWAVGRFDVLASHAKLPDQVARQIPAVKWFAAAGHINGGIAGTVRAEARDDQAAENLRDVVRGLLALGRMQAQADPKAKSLVDTLQLTGTGKTVQLSFTVPAEVLELLPKPPAAPAPMAPEAPEAPRPPQS